MITVTIQQRPQFYIQLVNTIDQLPWLPKRPKQKNSCSKIWPIDRLYIELGCQQFCLYALSKTFKACHQNLICIIFYIIFYYFHFISYLKISLYKKSISLEVHYGWWWTYQSLKLRMSWVKWLLLSSKFTVYTIEVWYFVSKIVLNFEKKMF